MAVWLMINWFNHDCLSNDSQSSLKWTTGWSLWTTGWCEWGLTVHNWLIISNCWILVNSGWDWLIMAVFFTNKNQELGVERSGWRKVTASLHVRVPRWYLTAEFHSVCALGIEAGPGKYHPLVGKRHFFDGTPALTKDFARCLKVLPHPGLVLSNEQPHLSNNQRPVMAPWVMVWPRLRSLGPPKSCQKYRCRSGP